jgi:hypothetical protein
MVCTDQITDQIRTGTPELSIKSLPKSLHRKTSKQEKDSKPMQGLSHLSMIADLDYMVESAAREESMD